MSDHKQKILRQQDAPDGSSKVSNTGDGDLTDSEKKVLKSILDRMRTRSEPARVKIDHKPHKPIEIHPADGREVAHLLARLSTFGTTSTDFYFRTFRELLNAGCHGTSSQPFEASDVNGALAAMHGIAPKDEIEGMLAAQMVTVHSAAMRCLSQLKNSENIPQQDSNGSLAVKLLRTYVMQMETLQRYRGKGEQKMTVEHVHVHQGGQAIVGAVHQGGGALTEVEDQPHAPRTITHEPGTPLRCEDAIREAVPVPCSKR